MRGALMRGARDAWLRSKDQDAAIQAWTWLAEPADTPTAAGPRNALAGVGFGVKDVIDVAGMPTRSGSLATSPEPARWDASCVAQLRTAGAVPIGKTVTAEFAYAAPGPTRNPHHALHTPGGSSSGSAAAVAAGMVDIALGTQTGGSMIRPAAFCGVVGFKPTFGRVHRQGMSVLCDSLDTIGWFSRTVAQSREVASVLLPQAEPDHASTRAPRVAMLACEAIGTLDTASRQALDDCAMRLREQGADLITPDVDADLKSLLHLHTQIMHAELARGLLSIARGSQADLLSPVLRNAIKLGLEISYADYVQCQQARDRLSQDWLRRFGEIDIIIAPSAPGPAPKGLQSTGSSVFNRIWSLLGWPALHLPTGQADNGLPVGVQWVARPDQDHALLAWAADWGTATGMATAR
ncbi:Glutamyl-tRNA(Gln) amidotransferase subunit A [Achromobacter spanius]|nr:Putative amidase AmiD [Achromobacter spanius]SPT38225.1 Glutamyl-tRNA(Gln) amidotransferase subunit A [Achromobacter denitrificans]VEE57151.1 Glutamyl-tRNA(Gln) amidotransferase subunit A [Achromobacter spanius]